MSKEELKNNNKAPKKKKSHYERQKFMMKVTGILMALVMIFGAVMSIIGMFIGA